MAEVLALRRNDAMAALSTVALFRNPSHTLSPRNKMHLALYQPDIPQNVGAAMRLSTCFDVALHIIEPCSFPLTAKGLRRAAMDYGASEDVTRHVSWTAFVDAGAARGGRTILLTTRGATPLWDVSFRPDDVIVCGRESAGVPDEVHTSVDVRALIPLSPAARSFNVVNAAAIALGEASRQLGLAGMNSGVREGHSQTG